MAQSALLTPDEVGELLRISSSAVIAMVEAGDLAGLKVAGHWRVTFESVKEFVSEGLKKQNLNVLERAFLDHSRWAQILQEDPQLALEIENGVFEPNSMGAFLQGRTSHVAHL